MAGIGVREFADHPEVLTAAYRLEELRSATTERCALALLKSSGVGAMVPHLEELVTRQPLRESAWILLVRALARAGRKADALGAARRCRRQLRSVGLDAQTELDEAEQAAHDLQAPAIDDEGRGRTRGNLPSPVSAFVGRAADLIELGERLGRCRLVTLVGPGGVGKTRLAVEALRRLPVVPADGVWACDLGPVGRDEAVAPAISDVLGLPSSGDVHERITGFCAPRRLLLLLDNCEHVLDGIAPIVEGVLRRAPAARILATSREPLAVDGEQLVDVGPLDTADAVALLIERIRAAGRPVTDDDEVIRRLSRRLEGLPLAIEMAAPWARTMSLHDLDQRLHHRLDLRSTRRTPDDRHRTLRAVLEWSHRRLSPPEQHLFRRLSVFRGSFSLEAAAAVAGWGPLDVDRIPELLRELVQRSLLVPVTAGQQSRFRMLETIAEYADEARVRAEPRHETTARKAAYFAGLADSIARGLRGPGETRWARAAELEMPNLRSAAHEAAAIGRDDEAVRIPAALYLLVLERLRSDVAMWARPCLRSAERARHPLLPAVRAVVALGELQGGRLHHAALMARWAVEAAGDTPEARFGHHVLCELAFATGRQSEGVRHAEDVIRLADDADDRYLAAHAFGNRCLLLGYAGEHDRARPLLVEFRHRARAVGSPTLQATADYIEGELLLDVHPARAIPLLDRAMATATTAGSAHIAGAARLSATTARARHGDPREALRSFPEAVRHWYERGDWTHQWPTLRNLVILLTETGAHDAAAVLLGGLETLGGRMFGEERQRVDAARTAVVDRLGPGAVAELVGRGRAMDGQELVGFALTSLDACQALNSSSPGTGP
ncbi:ATP-binding protein [Pseudonocardia sp. H11422]|uniref:ATP-binding protein n=1 Tax=Pseudonocardia sp. H11422 TaxID=2835866 RepID=UPI001BDD6301|nr:BTAD domain-containing putative transcriptional regulator [Pseudonocardia sp. H11422]